MCHMKIRIPSVNANTILLALGSIENAIEFIDIIDDLEDKKIYGSMVNRCDKVVRKIKDLESIANELNIPILKQYHYHTYQNQLKTDQEKRDKKFGLTYFDLTETEVLDTDKQVNELINSLSQIREDLFRLIERKYVLSKAAELLLKDINFKQSFANAEKGDDEINQSSSNLNLLTGVINASEELKMKRMLFRISHGRAISAFYDFHINREEYLFTSTIKQRGFSLAKHSDFNNNSLDSSLTSIASLNAGDGFHMKIKKKIFNVIFPSSEENYLQGKILKVCDIFEASRYGIPKNDLIQTELNMIEKDIAEKKRVVIDCERNLMEIIQKIFTNENNKASYQLYKLYFMQEKLVYLTLTKCQIHETFIDGEVWIPKSKLKQVQEALMSISNNKGEKEDREEQLTANLFPIENVNGIGINIGQGNGNGKKANRKPPTFIQCNEFLWAFQEIINTYGIPRYQEINPAYFAVISFPFMFGIMYGDIGHGLILLALSSYICLYSDSLKEKRSAIIELVLKARYLLLLMGFFALYCGILYNEFFAIPFEISSCYITPNMTPNGPPTPPIKDPSCTYYIGIDPQWLNSNNELTFINSLKMKFSVIIGVIQMIFGIVLKGINAWYDNQPMDFWLSFVPQLILMTSLFGYMNGLIIIKWLTDWTGRTAIAPDIKSMLMNIFLKFGEVSEPLWGTKEIQTIFHRCILALFLLSALIMFLLKTVLEYRHSVKEYIRKRNLALLDCNGLGIGNGNSNANEPLIDINAHLNNDAAVNIDESAPAFSNFFVNEVIETIEFVLGTVSNTASYLRLWALSLAHSQLSKVFLEQTILNKLIMSMFDGNMYFRAVMVFILYFFWCYLTIGVLLFMDLMECFLHTLRLHWLEFQGKFFRADGYQFKPFSFKGLFEDEEGHNNDNQAEAKVAEDKGA